MVTRQKHLPALFHLAVLLLWVLPACGLQAQAQNQTQTQTQNQNQNQTVDHLVVSKSAHTLTLFAQGRPIRVYSVALGRVAGPKRRQGDGRTPEGRYSIDSHNPNSAYHLALHISYPNADDRARARAAHVPTGGDIMIHGLPAGAGVLAPLQHWADWTIGCVALSNAEIEEVYRLVPNGTPIDITP